jgi:hypothetical protein
MRGLPLEVVGEYSADLEAVRGAAEWADVILFRPGGTDWACRDCGCEIANEALARFHAAQWGHGVYPENMRLRRFLNALGGRRAQVGLVCDVDWRVEPDTAWWIPAPVRDQAEGWHYPIETCDLITASTPRLARHMESFGPAVRVIRNSCDPSEYVPTEPQPEGKPRLVWYAASGPGQHAATGRLYDWEGPAQAAARDHRTRLRTVFVGAGFRTSYTGEGADLRAAGFDEARPAAPPRDWPRALANSWPALGVSPLKPSPHNSCRSEQHWLEYSALGCPTVAQRWRGNGPFPYDAVRDGVDGLLARGRKEWSDAIGKLARSPQLRADIGGRARERVIAEYNPTDRAVEMAEAFRWAAEHAGIGRHAAWMECEP